MISIKDRATWNSTLAEEFGGYEDIYFRYEYFDLYKRHYDVEPEAIFWEDENIKIFWPHLVRDISKIEKFKDFEYYDLTTPYGYGGPLITTKTRDKEKINSSLKKFLEEYQNYALRNNYVCEFIRFHPIFKNWRFFNKSFNVEYLNDVVVINLNKDLEGIWKSIKKGHRYNIKKSIREECKVEIVSTPTKKDIDNFVKIYYHTMDKNKASKKYYFSREFLNDHFSLLKSVLVKVEHNNQIIGASIFIFWRKVVHYHLSGATYGLKGVYPLDLMLWKAIKWVKTNNFELLNLGGGRGKNDSLFEFKKGFSNDTVPFYIGKKIFDIKTYKKLSTLNPMSAFSNNYFPEYRWDLDEKIV